MTIDTLQNVSVRTQASVYFDGKCISHGVTAPDGSKKSVGVILPSTLTFNTAEPETMQCVAGACDFRMSGATDWTRSSAGEQFSIPAKASFEIRVAEGHAAYHYICHFG